MLTLSHICDILQKPCFIGLQCLALNLNVILLILVSDKVDCADSPCVNGTCNDGVKEFTCDCDEGFYGKTCSECKVYFLKHSSALSNDFVKSVSHRLHVL